ncbi:MAG: hypothetical protein ACK53Y_18560 [bacterium]
MVAGRATVDCERSVVRRMDESDYRRRLSRQNRVLWYGEPQRFACKQWQVVSAEFRGYGWYNLASLFK